jgi:hypothetical protein
MSRLAAGAAAPQLSEPLLGAVERGPAAPPAALPSPDAYSLPVNFL